jgi:hypothetical protein
MREQTPLDSLNVQKITCILSCFHEMRGSAETLILKNHQ